MSTARPVTFTRGEHAALKAASVAVFLDRIILKAQPPITAKQLAAVAAQCAGPLPDDLIALWRTSFGGNLAYERPRRSSYARS